MAEPAGDARAGQRLDPASAPRRVGRRQPAAAGARPTGRDAARPPGPDPRQLLGARQARRRPHRPNPTDRGKRGTKYHIATMGDGVPVACAATAANVNDTLLFERLFLTAFAVVARIGTVFADKGYDAEHSRELCRAFGAEPRLHKRGRPRGSGLGKEALAGRAQQRLALGEQAPRPALRPARLHRAVATPGRLSLPGCRTPCPRIVTTASRHPPPPAATSGSVGTGFGIMAWPRGISGKSACRDDGRFRCGR